GILSVVRVTVEIEGEDRPACIAEPVSLYFPKK
ncbi:MAG: dehydratase, partial [Myxococcales bacterium]|nr:dehydratase [Myxococcales bacterium]